MSNNDTNNLIYLIEQGECDLIQEKINRLKGRLTVQEHNIIIDSIFNKLNLSNESVVRSLFNLKPQFSIKTYKELLSLKATLKFNNLKNQKSNVFISLSRDVCDDLEKYDVDYILKKYNQEFLYLNEVKMLSEFIYLIRTYKYSLISRDLSKIYDIKTKIREFFRRFNLKYKEEYIKKYCNDSLKKIVCDFEIKPKYEKTTILLSKDAFIKLSLNDIHIANVLKKKINNYFSIEIDNYDLKRIISNILNDKDIDNYRFLNINNNLTNITNKIKLFDENRSFNRLKRIYTKIINRLFDKDEKLIVVEILKKLNIDLFRDKFSTTKLQFLYYLLIIFKESKCNIELENNTIVFTKDNRLTNIEYISLKEDIQYYKMYDGLKNCILHFYYDASENKKEIISQENIDNVANVVFDDDNYQIKNNISLLNYKVLIDILKKIDYKKVSNYNDNQIIFLKKILYKEGLLGCVMKYGCCIDLSNIINGIDYCDEMDEKNIDIEKIVKLTSIYSIADDFTISILGSDVVRKLICSSQFLQTNTLEDKKIRLYKALYLNLLSIDVKTSSIPYDVTTNYQDVTISRYNNDNPKILSSGIDTGTCFKLDGDDNDFVVYTILNKNGAVLKIEYQDKFIGRISVIRKCKVLFLNSIRIKGEREEKLTKEVIDRNNKIYECLVKLVNKIIYVSHINNDDIDYIVCNKAGILESSFFKCNCSIVKEHIVSQPIDIYNDDWDKFINLPSFLLKQSNRGEKIPFTTDYGHYPALLISSYNNQELSSMWDIGYDSPKELYERPIRELKTYTHNFKELLEYIYRIDALKYYEENKDIKKCQNNYIKSKLNIKDIKKITLGDYYYKIEFLNGETKEVSLNNIENGKILIKK